MRFQFFALYLLTTTVFADNHINQLNPDDASVKIPTFTYESAFLDYRPLSVNSAISWQDANQAVMSSDGHMGHAMNSPVVPTPSDTDNAPLSHEHHDHKK